MIAVSGKKNSIVKIYVMISAIVKMPEFNWIALFLFDVVFQAILLLKFALEDLIVVLMLL